MAEINYALCYYALKAGEDGSGLARLWEDGVFGVHATQIDGRQVSRDLLDTASEIAFLERHTGIGSGACNLLDIGAGYGRLAHRLGEAGNPELRVFATNAYAPSTFICDCYLRFREATRATTVPLDEMDALLERTKIDVAINVHSFSECTPEAVACWVERLASRKVRHLIIVPNSGTSGGARCETNDGQDLELLFARYGYKPAVRAPSL